MQVPRDDNRIPVLEAVSNADGTTPIAPYANPATHELLCDNNSTGSDLSGDDAYRDENRVPGLLCASSADGETPVPIYVDSVTKKLLIQTL